MLAGNILSLTNTAAYRFANYPGGPDKRHLIGMDRHSVCGRFLMKVEIDIQELSRLENNTLALQDIANRVLADVAKIKNASASKPKKKKKDAAYYEAKTRELILTGKWTG